MAKKSLLLLLCTLTTLSGFAQETSGTCGKNGDNLTWDFDTSTGTLTISGTGEMADYSLWIIGLEPPAIPWCFIGNQITQLKIGNNVTSVGTGAFMCCHNLTSVSLPNSVTSIGEAAFANCANLTSITIPNKVANIGQQAFYKCTGLTTINVVADNPNYASQDGVVFNKAKTRLVCFPCGKSESYTTPDGVTNIGEYAFIDCDNLTSVVLSNSVTTIEYGAFWGSGLTSISFGNNVTTIGGRAFNQCYGLTSVTIPNSVTTIGQGALGGCFALTSIDIPNSVTTIEMGAFSSSGLTSITLPNSITNIPDGAFSGCNNLTSVSIPNSITSIGVQAFSGCGLISVTIPDSVTTIAATAFRCDNLATVVIGKRVTNIGNYVFLNCTSLTSITCRAPEPPTVANANAFYRVNKSTCKLYVPVGSKQYYEKAEGWKDFRYIEEDFSISMESDVPAASIQIAIYPNPVLEYFYINGIEEDTLITISDISGKMVQQSIVVPNEVVSVAHLPKGTYIVQAAGKTVKVIKL